jgi:chromate transporter
MTANQPNESGADHQMPSWREVFLYFLFLGFVNIGGPVAQITMMFNHMVEKRRWLSKDRFVKIMAFCHMLPGPEALQLAIYVGYLKRKLWGGVLAGLTFILPGAAVMIVLSWLYVHYGKLPQVMNALYVLKPAVLGIIAAGIIKLGQAAIRNFFLAVLLIGAFVGMRFAGINFLLILLMAGVLNLIVDQGWPLLKKATPTMPAMIGGMGLLIRDYFKLPGCFSKQGCSALAALMRHWFSSTAAQLRNITGCPMGNCWMGWRSVWRRQDHSCCSPHSSGTSPAELWEQL